MLTSAVAHSPAKQHSHHSPKWCIRAREDRNYFHQVLYLHPKSGNSLHFPYPATYVDVERQPGKELLNDLLSQRETMMPN